MQDAFDILNRAKDFEPRDIPEQDREKVAKGILPWLMSWEQASYIDSEPIFDAGILAACLGTESDTPVIQWVLSNRHSPEVIEITGYFLWGFWRASDKINIDHMDQMAAFLESTSPESMAHVATLLAIASAIKKELRSGSQRIALIKSLFALHVEQIERLGLHESALPLLRYALDQRPEEMKLAPS